MLLVFNVDFLIELGLQMSITGASADTSMCIIRLFPQ